MSIPEVDRAEKASLLGQAVLAATDALEDAQDELCRLASGPEAHAGWATLGRSASST